MTTELEQKFYDIFGIEPKYYCTYEKVAENKLEYECTDNDLEKCKKCKDVGKKYPEITAGKLLQLLCIVIDEYNRNGHTFYLDSTNVKELKEDILDALMGCIDTSCDLFATEVKQIQQLFKED